MLLKKIQAKELKSLEALLREAIAGLSVSYGYEVPDILLEKLHAQGTYNHFEQTLANSRPKRPTSLSAAATNSTAPVSFPLVPGS